MHKAIESTPRLYSDLESRRIYFNKKKPIKENSLIKLPDLANTLGLIATYGKDGFYKGETAKKIVEAMNKNNGLMSLEDFKNYKVYVRAPISTQYRGNRVCLLYTSPSPRD